MKNNLNQAHLIPKQRLSFLLLAVLVFGCGVSHSHTFDDTEILGDHLQVRLLPKYSNGSLIGIELYELYVDGNVGHAFLSQSSYYRFDTKLVTEDREWYRITGYSAETVLEVDNEYESQQWSITPDMASGFDRAARLVADKNTSIDDIRKVYSTFRIHPFSVKAGEKDREGQRRWKWLAGTQRINQVEIVLSRSPKYGNRFNARFAN